MAIYGNRMIFAIKGVMPFVLMVVVSGLMPLPAAGDDHAGFQRGVVPILQEHCV